MKRSWAGIALLSILAACSVDIPSDVISRRRMEKILYDYHLAQGMGDVDFSNAQEERYKMAQLVFQKHGITEAEFDSSMLWYSSHSHYLAEMYVSIEERLNKESEKMGVETMLSTLYNKYTEQGDTALIWRRKMAVVLADPGQNIQAYTLPADTNFLRGDAFQLHFTSRFLSQDFRNEGYVMFSARYDNDSVQAISMRLNSNTDTKLNLPAGELARDHDLKSLSIVFYQDPNDEVYHLWMVRNMFLLRIHDKELMQKKDTLAVDSLATDSLTTDSLIADSLPVRDSVANAPTAVSPKSDLLVPKTPLRPQRHL